MLLAASFVALKIHTNPSLLRLERLGTEGLAEVFDLEVGGTEAPKSDVPELPIFCAVRLVGPCAFFFRAPCSQHEVDWSAWPDGTMQYTATFGPLPAPC